MKNNSRFVGALVLFTICIGWGTVGAAPIPPEIKAVVAFIFVPAKQPGQLSPYGTGFFVGVKDTKNPGQLFLYLVSAKHVLQEADHKSWLPKIFVRLNTKNGESEVLELPLVLAGEHKNVFLHPDASVDIA